MSGTALASLVKGLPEALQRQYDYEDPIVRSGKHLMHSPFFKVRQHTYMYGLTVQVGWAIFISLTLSNLGNIQCLCGLCLVISTDF